MFNAAFLTLRGHRRDAEVLGNRPRSPRRRDSNQPASGIPGAVQIDNSYVSRMVNLTTLAPDIVAAILDDALPNHITPFDLAVDPPALWDEQRKRVGL